MVLDILPSAKLDLSATENGILHEAYHVLPFLSCSLHSICFSLAVLVITNLMNFSYVTFQKRLIVEDIYLIRINLDQSTIGCLSAVQWRFCN